jgi:hypothetical protein
MCGSLDAKMAIYISRYKCVHLYTPSLSSISQVPAAFLYVTRHGAGRQSHVKSLAHAVEYILIAAYTPANIPAVM